MPRRGEIKLIEIVNKIGSEDAEAGETLMRLVRSRSVPAEHISKLLKASGLQLSASAIRTWRRENLD